MLVDRRHFARLIAMASAVGVAAPSALARTAGDRYFNDRLQLSILRPKGWHFMSLVDFRAASRHQLLAIDDPDVVEFLRSPDDPPFLVITKFGSAYDDFNPCITCWDEAVEAGIGGDLDGHRQVLKAWRGLLAGVSLTQFPVQTALACGTKASRSVWHFTFEHDSGRSWRVNVRTILVRRGERINTFHFIDGDGADSAADMELDAAARSLSYGTNDGRL